MGASVCTCLSSSFSEKGFLRNPAQLYSLAFTEGVMALMTRMGSSAKSFRWRMVLIVS